MTLKEAIKICKEKIAECIPTPEGENPCVRCEAINLLLDNVGTPKTSAPTVKEIAKTIFDFRCEIDDDAKGIYIGETGGEWVTQHDNKLAEAIVKKYDTRK